LLDATLAAPVGVGDDGLLYLEEREGVTSVQGVGGPLVGMGVRRARLGNNGVLAGWSGGAAVLGADGSVVRSRGARIEVLGSVPDALELALDPEGRVGLLEPECVALETRSGFDRVPLPPGAPSGLAFVGTDALAVTLTPAGLEPWQGSAVHLLGLDGSVMARVEDAVEPRACRGELFVLAERGVGFAPGPAMALVPAEVELGEVPLGPGRASYGWTPDGLVAVRTAVEEAGLVRDDGSYLYRGSVTSLGLLGNEPIFVAGSLDGLEVRTPSRVLARAPSRHGLEVEVEPLSPHGLPGLLLRPRVARGAAMVVHGGPIGNVTRFPNPKVNWLLAHGYVVAQPDYSGSFGYGTAYRVRLHHGLGVREVHELAALAARLRAMVGAPVIGVGSSSAGYSLLRLSETEPASLDAIVASSPLVELVDDPELNWLAPLPRPRDIRLPRGPWVLLFHGTEDRVVPIEATRRLVASHRERGRMRLVELEGEGHSYSRSAQLRELAMMEELFQEAGLPAT